MFVPWLTIWTETPGTTAPVESVTVPVMLPPEICAAADRLRINASEQTLPVTQPMHRRSSPGDKKSVALAGIHKIRSQDIAPVNRISFNSANRFRSAPLPTESGIQPFLETDRSSVATLCT